MRNSSHVCEVMDTPPDFIPLCLESLLHCGDEGSQLSITSQLMGEDDVMCILPSLVCICAELGGCDGSEGRTMGHAPHVDGLVGVAWAMVRCMASSPERF